MLSRGIHFPNQASRKLISILNFTKVPNLHCHPIWEVKICSKIENKRYWGNILNTELTVVISEPCIHAWQPRTMSMRRSGTVPTHLLRFLHSTGLDPGHLNSTFSGRTKANCRRCGNASQVRYLLLSRRPTWCLTIISRSGYSFCPLREMSLGRSHIQYYIQ